MLRLLGATQEVYEQLVELARDMLADPDVIRLRDALARALRRAPRLEREDVEALAGIKATTTATDTEQGTFSALVSAWVADREGDVIEKTAFDRTIEAWMRSGKNLPLLLNHNDRGRCARSACDVCER